MAVNQNATGPGVDLATVGSALEATPHGAPARDDINLTPDAGGIGAGRPKSPWRIVLDRFRHNRAALTGAVILLLLYLSALFAGFLAPYSPFAVNYRTPDHPPHILRFHDVNGQFFWRPFIYRYELTDVMRRTYVLDPTQRYPVYFLVKGDPYKLWGLIPCDRHLFGIRAAGNPGGPPPKDVRLNLFGADRMGRDIFTRVLYGGQISLSIGLIGIAITMSLGMLVGGISGYYGGAIDTVLMRGVELLMSIPGLYLILALRAALYGESPLLHALFRVRPGEHLTSGQVYLLIIGILGLVGWGGTARVIRGMVLSVKQLDYVRAAHALGASNLRVILRHVLPNTFTYVIVSATLAVPGYILGEVALSFLGVGIEEPTASWGLMLRDGQNIYTLKAAPWVLIPGVFIFLAVFAFNFLGDGLRDALDPKAVE